MKPKDIDKFWSKVKRGNPDECWTWKGRVYRLYGYISIGRKNYGAHRLSWEINNGPIPEKLFFLHKCDNPPCVNPNHLFLGTQLDNMRDAIAKGRYPFLNQAGERHPRVKLSNEEVMDICRRLDRGENGTDIANLYGIKSNTVSCIHRGKIWGHLTNRKGADRKTKLSDDDVKLIRLKLKKGTSTKDIALEYGLYERYVRAIRDYEARRNPLKP